MNNAIKKNSNLNDKIFLYQGDVMISMFSKTVKVAQVPLTKEAVVYLKRNPDHVFKGREVFWIERNEDWYGTRHFKGICAVQLERSKWKHALFVKDMSNRKTF